VLKRTAVDRGMKEEIWSRPRFNCNLFIYLLCNSYQGTRKKWKKIQKKKHKKTQTKENIKQWIWS